MTSPLSASLICPLRIMFMASYPLSVRLAVLNEPNPSPGLTRRFMNLWSCSTVLFKYLLCRVSGLCCKKRLRLFLQHSPNDDPKPSR